MSRLFCVICADVPWSIIVMLRLSTPYQSQYRIFFKRMHIIQNFNFVNYEYKQLHNRSIRNTTCESIVHLNMSSIPDVNIRTPATGILEYLRFIHQVINL